MSIARASVCALVGGAVGVGLWAGIVALTGYEVGFVAWAVGGLAGLGALMGAQGRGSVAIGVIAGAIALASILGGKFISARMWVDAEADERTGENAAKCSLAFDAASELEADGIELEWPDIDEPAAENGFGYPPAAWSRAEQAWGAMNETERAELVAAVTGDEAAERDVATGVVFALSVLRPASLLWLCCGIGTAYKLGATRAGETTEVGGITVTSNAKSEGPLRGVPAPVTGPLSSLPPMASAPDDGLPLMSRARDAA